MNRFALGSDLRTACVDFTMEDVNRPMLSLSDDDFHHFHLVELPEKLRLGTGILAAEATRELEPLCVRLRDSDNAYTYQPQPYTVAIVAGTEAGLEIELDQQSWRRWRGGVLTAAEIERYFAQGSNASTDLCVEQWCRALTILYR